MFLRYGRVGAFKLYLLCHVGLRQIVEDKSNLFLDILWGLDNPFSLVGGHQQGVNVGCVYRGLEVGLGNRFKSINCVVCNYYMQKQHRGSGSFDNKHADSARLTGTSFLKLLGVGLVMVVVLAAVVVVVVVVTRVLG